MTDKKNHEVGLTKNCIALKQSDKKTHIHSNVFSYLYLTKNQAMCWT